MITLSEKMKTQEYAMSKHQRKIWWGYYSEDVIQRGLHNLISFKEYLKRMCPDYRGFAGKFQAL